MTEYRANGAFRQVEGVLKEAAAKMSDLQLSEPHTMREPPKFEHEMGGMKDRIRSQKAG